MENINLKDYALMCDCATDVARFGILSDFLKKGITDFLSYETKKEKMPTDEIDILKTKYQDFQTLFGLIINKEE